MCQSRKYGISYHLKISGGFRISIRGQDLRRGHFSVKINAKTKELGPVGGVGWKFLYVDPPLKMIYQFFPVYNVSVSFVAGDKMVEFPQFSAYSFYCQNCHIVRLCGPNTKNRTFSLGGILWPHYSY